MSVCARAHQILDVPWQCFIAQQPFIETFNKLCAGFSHSPICMSLRRSFELLDGIEIEPHKENNQRADNWTFKMLN